MKGQLQYVAGNEKVDPPGASVWKVTIPDCKTGSVTEIRAAGREGREGCVNQCFTR